MDSSSTNSIADASNPFYLHNGDSLSSTLISQQLVGDNYSLWSKSMKATPIVKNKVSFIDDTLPKSAVSSTDSFAWSCCNNILLSWFLNSVSKEIAASIIHIDTAKEMWKDLKNRFPQRYGRP
jgi:hypothetical protein